MSGRTLATVRRWSDGKGVGILDSDATPGGCWTHFSVVAVAGYRSLNAGQQVELEWESAEQDGRRFRATRVWPVGSSPVEPAPDPAGTAMTSSLTFDVELRD